MKDFEYKYKAIVTDVYDADTITCTIDLGFRTFLHKQKIRLYGINAPELRGESKLKGQISRDWLRDKILHENIVLKTYKDKQGKYGRWLGIVFYKGQDLNAEMYDRGLVDRANY